MAAWLKSRVLDGLSAMNRRSYGETTTMRLETESRLMVFTFLQTTDSQASISSLFLLLIAANSRFVSSRTSESSLPTK